jgi:hypothetical protein
LIGNHDLPLYRISRPPLFYHKDGHSKIQAAYDGAILSADLLAEPDEERSGSLPALRN